MRQPFCKAYRTDYARFHHRGKMLASESAQALGTEWSLWAPLPPGGPGFSRPPCRALLRKKSATKGATFPGKGRALDDIAEVLKARREWVKFF